MRLRVLLGLFFVCVANAATVRTSDRVVNFVTVHSEASSSSDAVGQLRPGDNAELLGSQGSYRNIKLADGTEGFVPTRWTVIVGSTGGSGGGTGGGLPGGASGPGIPGWDAPYGLPKATATSSSFEILSNRDYSVGYSETRRDPLWVAYHLFPETTDPNDPRPSSFTTDTRTTAQVADSCYTHSGFDRGHNVANHAMDSRYGKDGQDQSFLMSNVCPQQACLNRETWEAMEKVESETYAQASHIWTVTGPIFGSSPAIINCQVEVPDEFYKIILRIDANGNPQVLPIVMNQDVKGTHTIREFITTVDDIESRTGLDFFPDMNGTVQAAMEAATPDESWNLDTQLVPHFPCPASP
jgi:endonuclease G